MKKNMIWRSRVTDTRWKRFLIGVGMVVAVILVGWGVAEYTYQLRVQRLVNALNTVGQNALKPAGGISVAPAGVDYECLHALSALTAIDTGPCPRAGMDWLIPVTKGQETTFMKSVLQETGYDGGSVDQRTGGGVKNGVGVNIELTGLGDNKEPYAAPAGMQWLQIGITAVESR